VAVTVTSLMPAPLLPDTGASDKVMHALTYAVLTLWFCGAYRHRGAVSTGLALFGFGALLEILQGATATRTPEPADLLANSLGILAGMALALAGLNRWCAMVESLLTQDR